MFAAAGLLMCLLIAAMVSRGLTEAVTGSAGPSPAAYDHVPASPYNRNTLGIGIACAVSGLVFYGYLGLYPTFLREELGFTAAEAAFGASMGGLGAMMALPAGWLGDRLNQPRLLAFAFAATGVTSYFMYQVATSPSAQYVLSFLIGTFASGFLFTNCATAMQRAVRPEQVGRGPGCSSSRTTSPRPSPDCCSPAWSASSAGAAPVSGSSPSSPSWASPASPSSAPRPWSYRTGPGDPPSRRRVSPGRPGAAGGHASGGRKAVRLRHVRPEEPGYRRRRYGRGFRYLDVDGRPLRDPEALDRIRELVIPPAWEDVWICTRANGHLQAVGTDAAGRRQYLYHPLFRERQERAKHDHVLDVAEALPRIRAAAELHLGERGLTRNRVLATAVRLLDLGFFRIGGERYAELYETYGLTTLLREHTSCRRDEITFDYPAKHGAQQVHAVADPVTCEAVRALRRRRGGGERLLAYYRRPRWYDVTGPELNDYLREVGGLEVTAKDFRTWHATVLAAVALAVSRLAGDGGTVARRRAVTRAVREVAEYLGNTPAVARSSYINPRVIELYEEDVTVADALGELGEHAEFGVPATQGPVERAVLRMLRRAGEAG
ncbi:MAG: MFS transporter [Streptosporangiales bacterium]|nr:MFS transporter [Streptosporangiales bacterium]